jgi:hypothetical protein
MCRQVQLPVRHQRILTEFSLICSHKHLQFEIHVEFIGPYIRSLHDV